jgi:hypothetical protein
VLFDVMLRNHIQLILALVFLSASSCEKRDQHSDGKVSAIANIPRPLTPKDIEALPDVLTAAGLFDALWAVDLPDPPIFIYPSETPEHQYLVFAHPDDSKALDNRDFGHVRIIRIVHVSDDQRKGSVVWSDEPFIAPVVPASDPFQIDEPPSMN